MHVALLTDGVAPWVLGGMQRHSRMLAIHLARAGVDTTLFHTVYDPARRASAEALADFPTDVAERIRSIVVDFPHAGWLPGHYLRESKEYSGRLLARYRSERIDADFIYAQGLTGDAFATARRLGASQLPPVGVNQHGYEMFQPAADAASWLRSVMLRRPFAELARAADYVFSFPGPIQRIVEQRCRVPRDRIITIPNAIDESWIASSHAEPTAVRRFIFIGRHERRKGTPELTAAIRRIMPGSAEFHFVGPVPEMLQLRRRDVIYHGTVTDTNALQKLLDGCDALICPSHAEGMPTVVIEAMARGLAIIATDVGATREWVDETNGVLLERPTVNAIQAAILSFCEIPAAELAGLQRASLRKAAGFTWTRVAAMTVDAIGRIT